jgi:hypothetical protein
LLSHSPMSHPGSEKRVNLKRVLDRALLLWLRGDNLCQCF